MNWVDLVIILLLISAIFTGLRAGLLQLVFSAAGFIAGLIAGSWIARYAVSHFSNPLTKLLLVLVIEFGLAILLAGVGELISLRLRRRATRLHLDGANRTAGAVFEVLFSLLIIWFAASALNNIRTYNIGSAIRHSAIIRGLNGVLPRPPDSLAQLEKLINPNGFPDVFLGLEPRHTTVSPTNHVNNKAILADEKSVVKIQGVGCGGIVFGSGFVADKDLVVTNAHVVAGIARPQVVDQFGTYFATPVWFNPKLDVAILRVSGLPDPPLKISSKVLPDRDAVVIMGFPKGGQLTAEDAVVIDHVTAIGRDIYNQGIVSRNIYEVQADVEPGDSGGPLLAPDGTVAGVTFAKSVSQDNVG
ncbi:MAG TPA: MarP family serine protease, partial [Candidatus Saccharimonadales bacterium]|nr:MarP family serine protease [Candidatus Saccharimonadales bacterium]